jgi:branched-chain amino acid transport system substrate-binding protein
MKLRYSSALAITAMIAVACGTGGASPTPAGSPASTPVATGSPSGGTIKIGVDLPLSGGEAPNGEPTRNAIQLAVDEANANGGVAGYTIALDVRDDAVNGVHNPDQGATNAQALVADPSVVAMVGPYNSNVGRAQIPVTSAAGLLQCSPANTGPGLTKPEFGALDIRGTNAPSYIRVATTDDIQGPAMAQAMFDLGVKNVFIIDDTETYGKGIADTFEAKFTELGGTIAGRQGVANSDGTADYSGILTAALANDPDGVFFGGVTTTGGAKVRSQMVDAGMGDLPYGGGDGIVDGSGATTGSFINLAGAAAADAHGSVAAIHDIPDPDAFANKYRAAFTTDPGAYSASAYGCTQIILAAIEGAVGAGATDMSALRAGVRDFVFEATTPFDTVLGPVTFDENGDTSQKIISFYKTDMTAADGKGDWVFDYQQDFGE